MTSPRISLFRGTHAQLREFLGELLVDQGLPGACRWAERRLRPRDQAFAARYLTHRRRHMAEDKPRHRKALDSWLAERASRERAREEACRT